MFRNRRQFLKSTAACAAAATAVVKVATLLATDIADGRVREGSYGRMSFQNPIVTDRGLPVGNFWVWPIDQQRSYVAVAEWPRDGRKENGDTWLAKIHWKRTNQQMTPDGYERAGLR